MTPRHLVWTVLLLFGANIGLPAQSGLRIHLLDGSVLDAGPSGVASDGSFAVDGAQGPLTVPFSEVARCERDGRIRGAAGSDRILLLDSGDRLVGTLEDGSADDVKVVTQSAGTLVVPLDRIRRVLVPSQLDVGTVLPLPAETGDRLYLKARPGLLDVLPGEVVRIGRTRVVWDDGSDGDRVFAFDGPNPIVAVDVQPLEPFVPSREVEAVIWLLDGSCVSGRLEPSGSATGGLGCLMAKGTRVRIALDQIFRLEFRHGRVLALGDLSSKWTHRETPYFPNARGSGLIVDPGLTGGRPLAIGKRRFLRGVRIPARSRVTIPLDGRCTEFRTFVGADPRTADRVVLGTVVVSISVDGEERVPRQLHAAGRDPQQVKVSDLSGKRVLEIDVDFGSSHNVGALAVLGEPILLFDR